MPTWPAYAEIQWPGYAEQREKATLDSEMESGPNKVVKVKSRVTVKRPVSVYFATRADYDAFLVWFADDIGNGALWFDWFDPARKITRQARVAKGELGDAKPVSPFCFDAGWMLSLVLETWQ